MKVLWLCNICLPDVAEDFGLNKSNVGGWLTGLKNDLEMRDRIQLNIAFPLDNLKVIKKIVRKNVVYWGIPRKENKPTIYDKQMELEFKKLNELVEPDIIHIWGTEFPHTLAMVNSVGKRDNIVVSIQGLCSVISSHYYSNLPLDIISRFTFRDFLRWDNIIMQKKKFEKRGKFEIEALKKVTNVIGRTDWDKTVTELINPKRIYHFCNETLRPTFYDEKWDIDKIEKYSLFVSQGNYPIKGLHNVLEALPEVIRKFPQIKLYIAGENGIISKKMNEKIRISSYKKYLYEIIYKFNLQDNVIFMGSLTEEEMCKRFLKTHIFIMSSSLENESNALSEAKLLGVPCVSAFVGGVTSRLINKFDGLFYQHDAPYMLSECILRIFENDDLALELSKNARLKALETHNKEINTNRIIEIYEDIMK